MKRPCGCIVFAWCCLLAGSGDFALGGESDEPIKEAAGEATRALGPSEMQRLMMQPEVQALVQEEMARQAATGTFFDEAALKKVISNALAIEPEALPPMQLATGTHALDYYDHAREIEMLENSLPSTNGGGGAGHQPAWQRELQEEAMYPETQAVLEEAVLEHLNDGGRLDGAGLDEVLARAVPRLPTGRLRTVLEHATSAHRVLSQPQQIPDVEDTLASMHTEERTLLAEYRDVLADHGRLIRELSSWPPDVRRAAHRFLALSRSGIVDGPMEQHREQIDAMRAEAEAAQKRGYWDRSGRSGHVDGYLGMITSRQLSEVLSDGTEAISKSRSPTTPFFDATLFSQEQLEEYLDPFQGEVRLKAVPDYGITPEAKSYIIPTTHGAIRIYTSTAFGGPMLVNESRTDEVISLAPTGEATIAGREASISLIRYDEDRWETSVFAYDGWMSYHVVVAAKLEGAERERFVAFVRDLVENG